MKTIKKTVLIFIGCLGIAAITVDALAQPVLPASPYRELTPIGGGFREKKKDKEEKAVKKTDYETAQELMAVGKFDDAAPLLHRVVSDDARNADAWNDLGIVNHKLGHNAEALGNFERALSINPTRKDTRAHLGTVHLAMGNLPKAREQLAQLKTLCTAWCQEAQTLEERIKEYEAAHPA